MLTLENVAHTYGQHQVLRNLSFHLPHGQLGCLLGHSGCGKTTALRLIAGFETTLQGSIQIGHNLVSRPGHHLAPNKRQVGLMFQDYALFPHLSAAENIAFGLHGMGRSERHARIGEMLDLVGLQRHASSYPHQLSGGQQQRVALARALAPRPRALLLDEPFSNLDVKLRERLALDVREILKHEQITALLITHDQHEAFAVADMVGVLHQGIVQQWDTPFNLYHHPNNLFVAGFVGQGTLLPGSLDGSAYVSCELGRPTYTTAQGTTIPAPATDLVAVLIRPDAIAIDQTSPLHATVVRKVFHGADFIYTLRLPSGQLVLALIPSHHNHEVEEKIGIRLDVDHVVAFRKEKEEPGWAIFS